MLAAWVVDHFVDDHGAALSQGERRIVSEDDADRALGVGLDRVTLEDFRAYGGFNLGAVGTGDGDVSLGNLDLADGLLGRRLGELDDI